MEWAKFSQEKLVIMCLNNEHSPIYMKTKLKETLFTARRQPKIGKIFNNARGKMDKQSI